MKNQFWYKRKVEKPTKEGEEKQYDEFLDCFNVNKVIRGIVMGEQFIIILDDFNERVSDQPDVDRRGKQVGWKKVRETVQSEIHLSKEDAERYRKLTSIE